MKRGLTFQPMPSPPPQPPRCAVCGDRFAPFGIGPPAAKALQWFCGVCNEFQPATQQARAEAARAAIGVSNDDHD